MTLRPAGAYPAPNRRGILGTRPGHSGALSHRINNVTVLYQDKDHLGRLWTVTVDIPQPKDPAGSIRVAFHCPKPNGQDQRAHVDATSLWTPGIGWSGSWTPTRPRAVPLAVREAVETALQKLQEVA